MRVKHEIETTRNTYKSIYLSAISYALRTYLMVRIKNNIVKINLIFLFFLDE